MKRRHQGWPPQSHRFAADRRAREIERAIASCDCQAPDAESGARLVSMECPIHNENPYPRPESAALSYWRDKLWQSAKSVGIDLTDDQLELIGKDLCFAHEPNGPVRRVQAVGWNGMVTIAGMAGEFAPHLFVPAKTASV